MGACERGLALGAQLPVGLGLSRASRAQRRGARRADCPAPFHFLIAFRVWASHDSDIVA